MRKVETREIEGLKVTTTQLQPRGAFKLAAKLLKYLAPAFGRMKPDDPVDPRIVAGLLTDIMIGLDDDALDDFMAKVLACTLVIRPDDNGQLIKCDCSKPIDIDRAFEGRFGAMMEAIKFAIEVNFADFFGGGAPSARPETAPVTSK